jgi:hypothetical protein
VNRSSCASMRRTASCEPTRCPRTLIAHIDESLACADGEFAGARAPVQALNRRATLIATAEAAREEHRSGALWWLRAVREG